MDPTVEPASRDGSSSETSCRVPSSRRGESSNGSVSRAELSRWFEIGDELASALQPSRRGQRWIRRSSRLPAMVRARRRADKSPAVMDSAVEASSQEQRWIRRPSRPPAMVRARRRAGEFPPAVEARAAMDPSAEPTSRDGLRVHLASQTRFPDPPGHTKVTNIPNQTTRSQGKLTVARPTQGSSCEPVRQRKIRRSPRCLRWRWRRRSGRRRGERRQQCVESGGSSGRHGEDRRGSTKDEVDGRRVRQTTHGGPVTRVRWGKSQAFTLLVVRRRIRPL
jgi:hypothetical protein